MGLSTQIQKRLQQTIVAISRHAAGNGAVRDMRSLVVGTARMASAPKRMREAVEQISKIEAAKRNENESWIRHDAISAGQEGRFDATDLQCWLAIAQRANVPFIEAREILALEFEELEALLGTINLSSSKRTARAMDKIAKGLRQAFPDAQPNPGTPASAIDIEEVTERCFAALDNVPEGWMVRAHCCGSNDLKALAGCGVTDNKAPEVRFGSSLEVGPGWIRQGNRRRVTFEDERILKLYMHDDTRPLTFLARPWIPSSRYLEGRDPHRAGSDLDIPGHWPAEWRAFVQKGKVTGVSFYYPHAGRTDPHSAAMALKVRELAQAMVNQAIADRLQPRMAESAIMKESPIHAAALPELGMGDDDFGCVLDFIETDKGILFLEGGPACTPFGGGHPCGFISERDEVEIGEQRYPTIKLEGVAFSHRDVLTVQADAQRPPVRDVRSWEEAISIANSKSGSADG